MAGYLIMPFRQRLKSIVKGDPVFEHLRQRRVTASQHEEPQHIEGRHSDVEHPRDPNVSQRNYNLVRERATRAAVVNSGPSYTTQERARKHEDIVRGTDEIGGPMGGRREGRILKDPLRDKGASESLMRHEEALVGHSDIGGGGYDVDRRTKAPPPPPPASAPAVPKRSVDRTAAAAARHALSLGGATAGEGQEGSPKPTRDLRDDLRVPCGPQQERLAVTQEGVIQDQQGIRESMAIDDTGAKVPGPVYTSRQEFDRPASSRVLSDEELYRNSMPTTGRLGQIQTAVEPRMRDGRSRSYPDESMSKGAMYNIPQSPSPEHNTAHNRSKDDIYVTEGPSGYYTSARTMGPGGDEQRKGNMQEITAPPTVGAGGRDRALSDTPIDKDVRWGLREYTSPIVAGGAMRTGDRTREYKFGYYKLSSGRTAESSFETHTHHTPGTTAELERTGPTPARESSLPITTSQPEFVQYSILHNILPPTYEVDPDEGPYHRSVNLGGRSSSALSNRSNMSNLRDWGLDPTAEVYEITNFGGRKRAPVMGVEEEGEWYKDDPIRGGCYCKAGGDGAVKVKEGGNVRGDRGEVMTAGKEG
ncbi:hypothetical protein EV426DRAFT_162105 [Tirmania nivea]|nr:hypothetical protein EV426DRAFT_162105 [Tirmania nivea]